MDAPDNSETILRNAALGNLSLGVKAPRGVRCAAMRLTPGRAPLNELFAHLSPFPLVLSVLLGRHAWASATC